MAEDYYKILGVSKNASEDEIQKAYRKQARKYHPDLHVDKDEKEKKRVTQKFQQIQQAYDTLSDTKKRQMYDQFGPQYEQMGGGGRNPFGGGGGGGSFGDGIDLSQLFGGGGGGGGGFEDIFRQMGGGGGGRTAQRAPASGEDIEKEITIPFGTAVLGGKHQVNFQRVNGKQEKINVSIPAGIESGKKIRLRGQGQAGPGGTAGDLLIKVNIAAHPSYARKGLNLMVDVPITILEAVEGAKIDLATPHGTVSLTVPAGTSSGKSLRLKGMGIKSKARSGDLMASLEIVLPDELDDEDIEKLKKLSDGWHTSDARKKLRW